MVLQTIISSNQWVVLLAYLFGVLGGHFLIAWTLSIMWELLVLEAQSHNWSPSNAARDPFVRYRWQIASVGLIERTLYIATIQIGRPEFIAVWLTLKTVVQARRWTEEDINPGRAVYNNFLVGNGLSILYSLVAAGVIQWTTGSAFQRDYVLALSVPIILAFSNGILALWLTRRRNKMRSDLAAKNQRTT